MPTEAVGVVIALLIISGVLFAVGVFGICVMTLAKWTDFEPQPLDDDVADPADDERTYSDHRIIAEADAVIRMERSRLAHPSLYDQEAS